MFYEGFSKIIFKINRNQMFHYCHTLSVSLSHSLSRSQTYLSCPLSFHPTPPWKPSSSPWPNRSGVENTRSSVGQPDPGSSLSWWHLCLHLRSLSAVTTLFQFWSSIHVKTSSFLFRHHHSCGAYQGIQSDACCQFSVGLNQLLHHPLWLCHTLVHRC